MIRPNRKRRNLKKSWPSWWMNRASKILSSRECRLVSRQYWCFIVLLYFNTLNFKQEMLLRETNRLRFGSVHVIKDCDHFLAAVDGEDKSVSVIILLHEPNSPGCLSAIKAVESLSKAYAHVKFCSVRPSLISMSTNFKVSGVPALLAYKSGQLVGNFVRMTDELGEEFATCDLESYLIEHGILNDRNLVPNVVQMESSDEDWKSTQTKNQLLLFHSVSIISYLNEKICDYKSFHRRWPKKKCFCLCVYYSNHFRVADVKVFFWRACGSRKRKSGGESIPGQIIPTAIA